MIRFMLLCALFWVTEASAESDRERRYRMDREDYYANNQRLLESQIQTNNLLQQSLNSQSSNEDCTVNKRLINFLASKIKELQDENDELKKGHHERCPLAK
jgi:hypothetical protein